MIPRTRIFAGLGARGEYTDRDLAVIGLARVETTGLRGGLVVDAVRLRRRPGC